MELFGEGGGREQQYAGSGGFGGDGGLEGNEASSKRASRNIYASNACMHDSFHHHDSHSPFS